MRGFQRQPSSMNIMDIEEGRAKDLKGSYYRCRLTNPYLIIQAILQVLQLFFLIAFDSLASIIRL